MAQPPTTGFWKPYLDGDSAHFTPQPDEGEWKFYSDFVGLQYRYYNEASDWLIFSEGYWLPTDILHPKGRRWRITKADGSTRDLRRFKSVKGAIRAIEQMEDCDQHGA